MFSDFDFSRVGKEIKRLRIALGLSQKDLICGGLTQSTLSKIENGEAQNIRVSSFLTICERLGIDPNYFKNIATIDSFAYVDNVMKRMDSCRQRSEFNKLYRIVKTEKDLRHFESRKLKQYMLWNEAICWFYLKNEYDLTIKQLQAALELTYRKGNNYTLREIEILVSIAGVQMDYGLKDNAITTYKQCLDYINRIEPIQNIEIKTKVYSNIVKWKANHKQHYDSIEYCYIGIDWCNEHKSLYLLENFYYYIGYNYDLLKEYKQAKDYYHKALFLLTNQNMTEQIKLVREKIELLKLK